MEYESEIKRLELFVERLLEGYTNLKEETKKQQQEFRVQQDENEQLRQQIEAMESERGDLGNRVSMLIDRIESWETELESEGIEDDSSDGRAAELPPVPDEQDEAVEGEDDDDAGGGVQGNLFSASSKAD